MGSRHGREKESEGMSDEAERKRREGHPERVREKPRERHSH